MNVSMFSNGVRVLSSAMYYYTGLTNMVAGKPEITPPTSQVAGDVNSDCSDPVRL